jgi:hypothetical protein
MSRRIPLKLKEKKEILGNEKIQESRHFLEYNRLLPEQLNSFAIGVLEMISSVMTTNSSPARFDQDPGSAYVPCLPWL